MNPTPANIAPDLVAEFARHAGAWMQRAAGSGPSLVDFLALAMFLQAHPMLYHFGWVILAALKTVQGQTKQVRH